MEETWLIKRQQLRELLREPRLRSYRELADETGASLAWVKRWVARLRPDLTNDALLHRRASPRSLAPAEPLVGGRREDFGHS